MSDNLKIFNIGFNKSGTTSLTEGMKLLGFKSIHYKLNGKRIREIINENKKEGKKLLEGIEEFDCYSEISVDSIFKDLDRQYPHSKFILTIRNVNDWLESTRKHIERNGRKPNYDGQWTEFNKEERLHFREQYLKDVQEYFKERKQDLLILDLFSEDNPWESLCKFLDIKEIPTIPFPHKNSAKDHPYS